MDDDPLVRIQTALERRVSVYSVKARITDPFADATENAHHRYAFALECFQVFAREAGLRWPVEQEIETPNA
jgi:hypothetical protein